MNPSSNSLEDRLRQAAHRQVFPPTPDLSAPVRRRIEKRIPRRVLAFRAITIAVVLLLAAAVAIPESRAALVGYFRLGAVRIFPEPPEPTITPAKGTPDPTSPPKKLPDLAGRITLEEALDRRDFDLRLPAYPPDLGVPDDVYYQPEFPMLVLVWRDPDDLQRSRLSLFQVASDSVFVSKIEPEIVQETAVDGGYALWVKGPYLVQLSNGNFALQRLVNGHTLVWEAGAWTYRLETDLPLAEAIKIAESLR